MSARSIGRSAAASQNNRNSASPSKDRSTLCTFTFSDGRRCRTPRHSAHPHLCYFHARKEAQACAADQLGRDLSFYTSRHYLSACNLSSALARVFTAAAQGHIKTKTATALAYTAQVLVQTLHLAQHEYIETLGESGWRQTINSHITSNCDYINAQRPLTPQPSTPSPHPAPPPQPDPAPSSDHAPKPPAATPVAPPPPPSAATPPPPQPVPTQPPQPAAAPPPPPSSPPSPPIPAPAPPLVPQTVPGSPSPTLQPTSTSSSSQPPLPAGIGTLGNWNPPPHSGPPRRARRGPGRHINLCPSRLP